MTVIPVGSRLTRVVFAAVAAGLLVSSSPIGSRVLTGARVASAAPRQTVNCDVDTTQLAPSSVELDLLRSVNLYRAAFGIGPLAFDTALQRAALWKGNYIVQQRVFAHDDAFRTYIQRGKDCGYPADTIPFSENLGGGVDSAVGILTQWQNSTDHNAALLRADFTAVGIKRVQAQADDQYGWYWVIMFGGQVIEPLPVAALSQ